MLDLIDTIFSRYVLVGLLSTATHVGVLAMQMEWLDMDILVATVIAFTASLIVSFALNYVFAFRSNSKVIESAIKFTIVCVAGLTLNVLVMEIFVNRVGLHYGFATLVAIVVVTINNFSLHYFWTFRVPKHHGAP
ncbi:MAG: GtrA family protein [bacterium]